MIETAMRTAGDCYRTICANTAAGKPWLITDRRTVSFGELRTRIEAMAGWLQSQGIAVGERVVIASRDDAEVSLLFLALVCNGITVVNIDPDTGVERAQSLVKRADARLLLIDRDLAAKWTAGDLPGQLVEIVASTANAGKLLGKLLGKGRATEGLHALLAKALPQPPPAMLADDTLAYVLFTSGTTDQPKGVCISHRALFAHLDTLARRFGEDASSRILNTLMLSHADGIVQGPLLCFYTQATLLRPMRFEVSTIEPLLDAIYQLRATHMVVVPTMLALIQRLGLELRDAFQGGDFRLLISCGAQLEKKLWQDFQDSFRVPMVNMYGLTETVTGGVFAGPDAFSGCHGSIGLPVDCELRIVDENAAAVAPGQSGALHMRGDLLMSGYFRDPATTAAVLQEGWLDTGDIARQDEQGRYWVVGRAKSIIIYGGYNVCPEEVTEVLQRHPGVREAVTLGLPDATWGEIIASLVAVEPDAGVDVQALKAYCAAGLEPRKVPTRIELVESLPRGRSGKVMMAAARELFDAAAFPDRATPAQPHDHAQRLLKVAAASFKTDPGKITLHSTPRDVPGWDSLAHMELVTALEKEFGVQLDARDIMALDRLDKALAMIVP